MADHAVLGNANDTDSLKSRVHIDGLIYGCGQVTEGVSCWGCLGGDGQFGIGITPL